VKRALRTRLRISAALLALLLVAVRPCSAWESWGGDAGGSRFSPLRVITPDSVGQAMPLFVEDSLIFRSPFNEAIALAIIALVIAGLRWLRRRRIT
jgi:quinoprotein glucose dehydrogenase